MTRVYGIRRGNQWWIDFNGLWKQWSYRDDMPAMFGSIGAARDHAKQRGLGEDIEIVEL